MKTEIIALARHDDLISIRDRMSWAKAPRILIVWPSKERVTLDALDLRILQQHARELGAELGIVARGQGIHRDALSFGIPVFQTTADAQRTVWPSRRLRRGPRRGSPRNRLARVRELRDQARTGDRGWQASAGVRLGSFGLAVLAVISVAALFVPRAEVVLHPETRQQALNLVLSVGAGAGAAALNGGLPAELTSVSVSGALSRPVTSESRLATTRATGVVRFQNISAASILVPAGTVVYSLQPKLIRFVTLQDAPLEPGDNDAADVPIEAVDAGEGANLPTNSVQGVEGTLSASVQVTNAEPTTGGASDVVSVPSQADRDQLRTELLQQLQADAQALVSSALEEGDLLLPGSPSLAAIDRESFDPSAGQAAGMLTLMLDATYQAQFVRGADLRALASLTLDAQLPAGFVPKAGTLSVHVKQVLAQGDGGPAQLEVQLSRTLNKEINLLKATHLILGASPSRAAALLAEADALVEAPEVRLRPRWWPWLPLIPFRIELTVE